jgi:hypothetical protein
MVRKLESLATMTREEMHERSIRSYNALKQIQVMVQKGAQTRHLEEPCGECGEREVYCLHIDLGLVDYYDNYAHVCLACLDAKHSELHTGATQDSGTEGQCAFCSYDWFKRN